MGRGSADFIEWLKPLRKWAAQLIFAFACSVAMILTRLVVDRLVPGAGPFALIYPAVMIATLFGRWQSGALTLIFLILFVWYVVLPPTYSFEFASANDLSRTVVNSGSGILVIALAEWSRRRFRRAIAERNETIAEKELFLRELDHRVKNNFTIVMAMLALQARRSQDEGTKDALRIALSRVNGIAQAHTYLYAGSTKADVVEMKEYISALCHNLSEALFVGEPITLNCKSVEITIDRDRAIAVGLIINELVINAAKHAFVGRDNGEINIQLDSGPDHLRLTLADNGVGLPPQKREGALGQELIKGFCQQARGVLTATSTTQGTTFVLDMSV